MKLPNQALKTNCPLASSLDAAWRLGSDLCPLACFSGASRSALRYYTTREAMSMREHHRREALK